MSLHYITIYYHQCIPPKKSIHTLALCHVSIRGVSSSYATCWMLVHAYATLPRKTKWSGPYHTIKMLHFVLFHNITCYTNYIIPHIHVNTTKLRNITCTLVATNVILRSLECISGRFCWMDERYALSLSLCAFFCHKWGHK
jgi:hypothetical protein